MNLLEHAWTLAILRELAVRPLRVTEILRRVGASSSEQVGSRLKAMADDGLVVAERFREVPPRVEYTLTEKGEAALAVVYAMSQFARAQCLDPIRPGEAVDVAAILRGLAVALRFKPERNLMPKRKSDPALIYIVRDERGAIEARYDIRYSEDVERAMLFEVDPALGGAGRVMDGTRSQWEAFLLRGEPWAGRYENDLGEWAAITLLDRVAYVREEVAA